jgi:hypothetical protein
MNLAGISRYDHGYITWDAYHGRAMRFDGAGEAVDEVHVDPRPGRRTRVIGGFRNSILVEFARIGFLGEGAAGPMEIRDSVQYAVVDVASGAITFEVVVPGEERFVQRLGSRSMNGGLSVIFGRRATAAVAQGYAYIGTTDSLSITAYGEHGVAKSFHFMHDQEAVTDEWKWLVRDTIQSYTQALPAEFGPGSQFLDNIVKFRMALLDDLPTRSTLPSFSDMMGGSDGQLWIRAYPNPTETLVRWVAIDSSGNRTTALLVPTDMDVLDMSANRVLALAKGTLGEHIVEVYDVNDE